MQSSRNRLIFGILSLVWLVSSAYLLFSLAVNISGSFPQYDILVMSAISGFNAAILLAWLSADIPGGTLMMLLALVVSGLFDLRTLFYGSLGFTIQFFLAFALGYLFHVSKNSEARSYTLKKEKIDEDLSQILSLIDEKKKLSFALERKFERYLTLKSVVESFSAILPVDGISMLILDKALDTLGKPGRSLLYLVDVERQELMLSAIRQKLRANPELAGGSASRNEARVKAKRGDIFDQWVLRHRRSIIVEDVTKDFRFPAGDAEKASREFISLVASPLMSEDKVIGILRMDSANPAFFSQDDLRLLDIIANLGAVAVQNSYLYSRTQELAIHDGLTGLFVRRYFLERFGEELKRVAGRQGKLSVLLIDIDHFKDYNDKYGHTAGDIVLKHLAQIITSMVRQGDIVARYGGEEIVIVLSGRDKTKALSEAEAMRRAIAERPFSLRRHETNITVSIGLSQYPGDSLTEEGLVSAADDRLYKAKREGRDRVCSV